MATTDDPFDVGAAIRAHNMRAAGRTDDDTETPSPVMFTGARLLRQRMEEFQQEVWYRQAGFTVPQPAPTAPDPHPASQLALPLEP
jgi:hypothetical protein